MRSPSRHVLFSVGQRFLGARVRERLTLGARNRSGICSQSEAISAQIADIGRAALLTLFDIVLAIVRGCLQSNRLGARLATMTKGWAAVWRLSEVECDCSRWSGEVDAAASDPVQAIRGSAC